MARSSRTPGISWVSHLRPSRSLSRWFRPVLITWLVASPALGADAEEDFGILSPQALVEALRRGDVPFQASWERLAAGTDYVPNELVVGFDPQDFSLSPGMDPTGVTEGQFLQLSDEIEQHGRPIAERYHLELIDTAPNLRAALYRATAQTDTAVLEIARQLNAAGKVLFAEPNAVARIGSTEPGDPTYVSQYWHYSYIGAQRAWDTLPRDFHVRVAVIDTGFRFDHPDISPNVSQIEDYDFVSQGDFFDCSSGRWPRDWDMQGMDDDATDDMQLDDRFDAKGNFDCKEQAGATFSHGHHVANTILSGWGNGQGGVGVFGRLDPDPNDPVSQLELIPIRAGAADGVFRIWDIARAIQYTAGVRVSDGHGGTVRIPAVDIVNMSFSGPAPSIVQLLALNAAWQQGVLLVAAAGNDGNAQPRFPAAFNEVIAVSNMDSTEGLSSSSSFGPHIELTAPGTSVSSNSFDYTGCPVVAGVSCVIPLNGIATSGNASGAILSGTSMASPHVAGVAALYLAHNPGWNNLAVRLALHANAADWGAPGQDDNFGLGLVQVAPGPGVKLVTKYELPTVFLVEAATGLTIAQMEAIPVAGDNFSFAFTNVPRGDYYVLIATDEDRDGVFAETGEPVGAVNGVVQNPGLFSLLLQGDITDTFHISDFGWPDHDPEPSNDSRTGGGLLPLGYYAQSTRDYLLDEDWYRIRAPWDGDFRFWTEGINTLMCREELGEYDPVMELYDAAGNLVDFNDDDSFAVIDERCAEIEVFLTAGEYYLRLYSNPPGVSPAPLGKKVVVHFDVD